MLHNRSFINRRHREQDNKNIFLNFGFTHFILIFYSSLAGPFTSLVVLQKKHTMNLFTQHQQIFLKTGVAVCSIHFSQSTQKIFTHFDLHCWRLLEGTTYICTYIYYVTFFSPSNWDGAQINKSVIVCAKITYILTRVNGKTTHTQIIK